MKEVVAHDGPFTLADMEGILDTVDRSTIFRTLTLFLTHDIIHEVDNGSGSKMYCRCECASVHYSHLHFTCTACGKTFCLKDVDTSVISHPKGFVVKEVNFVMKGLCPECSNQEE